MSLSAIGGELHLATRKARLGRPPKPAEPRQLELVDVATREPFHRRTLSPVRRDSHPMGACEANWWSPFDPKDKHRFMVAAERFDDEGKAPGARRGALGLHALKVLRCLLRLVDYRTGRLDPAINTLAELCKLNRSTVVAALQRLRQAGFLSWIRRFAPTGQRGVRGPQVEQVSNAYRLSLPERAQRLIRRLSPPKLPEDIEADRAARAADRRRMAAEDETTPMGSALSRLEAAVKARDQARNASRTDHLNPGRSRK